MSLIDIDFKLLLKICSKVKGNYGQNTTEALFLYLSAITCIGPYKQNKLNKRIKITNPFTYIMFIIL